MDKKLTEFLRAEGIETSGRNVIVLEQRLITGDKYLVRHAKVGNAPTEQDWKNLMDYLADADVYWDNRDKKKNLLFLKKLTDSEYIKIAVDVEATERYLKLPKTAKQRFDDRIISTSSPMHFVFHEAGHKWVLKHLTNRYKFIPIKWLEKSDGKWFEKNISWNAGRKPEEAVAELFAMKMAGDEISAQAVSLIAKYAKEFAKWLY
ncbi:MAG: hypothetical protein IK015_06145 [Treponema sp.]|nr:hypothetical protein [Treponema sp.]